MATASTDLQYANHPHDGTTEDILKYTLVEEIMATAKIGCYAGTNSIMDHAMYLLFCALYIKGYFKFFLLLGQLNLLFSSTLNYHGMGTTQPHILVAAQM